MGRFVEPTGDARGVRQGDQGERVTGARRVADAADQRGERETTRRRIESFGGEPAEGDDDSRSHQGDLVIEMRCAQRDLGGGRGTIPFARATRRLAGEAFRETGQIKALVQGAGGQPGASQPPLQRLAGRAGVRQRPLPGGRSWRLPDDHQPLPDMATKDRPRGRDEAPFDTAGAGGDLPANLLQGRLT